MVQLVGLKTETLVNQFGPQNWIVEEPLNWKINKKIEKLDI